MAAQAKYPATHEQLFVLAREARLAGVAFAKWWREAVRPGLPPVTWRMAEDVRPFGCVVWPNDSADRDISVAVTLAARDGWRRAYDRLPPRKGELALSRLAPAIEGLAEREADPPAGRSLVAA